MKHHTKISNENLNNRIEKVKISCEANAVSEHFADVSKTIEMPKGVMKKEEKEIFVAEIIIIPDKKKGKFGFETIEIKGQRL